MSRAPEASLPTVSDRLIGHYALEADIYTSLLDIARKQAQHLETPGNAGRCTALFERRDELLGDLARIEAEIEPLKRDWLTERAAPEPCGRLNDLLDGILDTIEAIIEQESRNKQLLVKQQQRGEAELGHISRGSAVHRTHVHGLDTTPRFIDLRR